MNKIIVFCGIFWASNLSAGDAISIENWLRPQPQGWNTRTDLIEVDAAYVVEPIHTRVAYCLQHLIGASALEIKESLALFITGRKFRAKDGEKIVLLRSVFGNGATGDYTIWRSDDGKELSISHLSLGASAPLTISSVITSLPSVPKQVYGSVAVAK